MRNWGWMCYNARTSQFSIVFHVREFRQYLVKRGSDSRSEPLSYEAEPQKFKKIKAIFKKLT